MTTAILSALPEEQSGLLASLQQGEPVRHAGRVFHRRRAAGPARGAGAQSASARWLRRPRPPRWSSAWAPRASSSPAWPAAWARACAWATWWWRRTMCSTTWTPRRCSRAGEVPGYAGVRLPCDAALTALLSGAVSACLASAGGHFDHEFMQGAPRLHQGLVASGDRFVSCAQVSRALREPLRAAGHEVLAVEMEGAAVAQVCLTTACRSRPCAPSRTAPTTRRTWTFRASSRPWPAAMPTRSCAGFCGHCKINSYQRLLYKRSGLIWLKFSASRAF